MRTLGAMRRACRGFVLPGVSGNHALTGNLAGSQIWDVIVFGQLLPALASFTALASKGVNGDGLEIALGYSSSDRLQFVGNTDGTSGNRKSILSDVGALTPYLGQRVALRVAFRDSDGAGNAEAIFYAARDFTEFATWVQLGATKTIATFTQFSEASALYVGRGSGTFNPGYGVIEYASFKRTVGGAIAAKFNPGRVSGNPVAFTSETGEAWTVISSRPAA